MVAWQNRWDQSMPALRHGLPAYKQIQNEILRRLECGKLKTGDVVDSERELARAAQNPVQQVDELHRTNVRPGLESLF